MRIESEDLALKLQSIQAAGRMPAAWTIVGNEPLLADETADALRACARRLGFTERVSLGFSATSDWTPLIDAGANGSLFDEKKIVEVRFLSSGPGVRGVKVLENYLSTMKAVDSVTTVFRLGEVDWQTQKAPWFKALCEETLTVFCETVSPNDLPRWIRARLRNQKQTIDDEALAFFAAQTEGNLLAANQEIRKLAFLYPEGNLTLENIEASVLDVSRFSLDAFTDALVSGDTAKVAKIVTRMKDQDEPLPVIVAIVAGLLNDVITLSVNPRGFARAASKRLSRRITPEKAAVALSRLTDVDRLSKGLRAPMRNDAWDELQSVALYLAK